MSDSKIKEAVVGHGISGSKYILAATGLGFLGAIFGFLTYFAIAIGIAIILVGAKWIKGSFGKMCSYVLGGVMITAGIATVIWSEATMVNATSADFRAQGGIWKLFGYAMIPMDYANKLIFNKPAGTTWNQVRGVTFGTTTAANPLGTTPSTESCGYYSSV